MTNNQRSNCQHSLDHRESKKVPEKKQFYSLPGGSDGKETACNVGELSSIPGLGRSPRADITTHSSMLAWKIPRTEEPGRLQSMG